MVQTAPSVVPDATVTPPVLNVKESEVKPFTPLPSESVPSMR